MFFRFLIIAPGTWGAGACLKEAKKNLRKEGGSLRKSITFMLWADKPFNHEDKDAPHAYVDGMGSLMYRHCQYREIDRS